MATYAPLVLASGLALAGCSDGSAGGDGSGGGAPSSSAILLAGQIYSPESYTTYVGVLPAVPEGDVDFATFLELGNANAYTRTAAMCSWSKTAP